MTTGTVKWFNSTKGFGFIQPDNGGPDAFVHISAVERSGMREIVEHFDLTRRSPLAPPRRGAVNGYWHGLPGKPGLPAG